MQEKYAFVVNGRFKGGHITRHYGDPQNSIDAIQLELAQCNYMDEDTFAYDAERAPDVQRLIRELLLNCLHAP